MAKATKSTPAPVAPKAPAAPAPEQAAPAPAPEQAAPAPVVLRHTGKPLTHSDVWRFVQDHAGGNPANVRIVPLPNVAKDAARPLPFAAMDKAGKRSTILWGLVNGVKTKDGVSDRLSMFRALSVANGASGSKLADLVAALNGGFSPSSKSWGTGFVQLEVVPAPAPAQA